MGLFDKKYCDVCGDKIGLLGNRKLEDGNLCKNCAKKLSPLFSERRHSTVAEIKEQLAYREQNAEELNNFHPDRTYGRSKKIFVDTAAKKFIVTFFSDWKDENPDLISFSQVKNIQSNVEERKNELYYKDDEGKNKSYVPPRYEYEYSFILKIFVDSPWFDEIKVELNGTPGPDSPYAPEYRECEFQIKEITELLMNQPLSQPSQPSQPTQTQTAAETDGWTCACGAVNSGKFCSSCGNPKPENKPKFCTNCGWKNTDPANTPKFCPECGSKLG